MDLLSVNKKIVQLLTIVICLKRKTVAVRNAKVISVKFIFVLDFLSLLIYKFWLIIFIYVMDFFVSFHSSGIDISLVFSFEYIRSVKLECIYKGERYASGAEWSDPDDPCASFKCVAGVVTESNMQCYTPCNNPLSPRKGQCCSACLGKFVVFFFWFFSVCFVLFV